jgi:hypothetical protein
LNAVEILCPEVNVSPPHKNQTVAALLRVREWVRNPHYINEHDMGAMRRMAANALKMMVPKAHLHLIKSMKANSFNMALKKLVTGTLTPVEKAQNIFDVSDDERRVEVSLDTTRLWY